MPGIAREGDARATATRGTTFSAPPGVSVPPGVAAATGEWTTPQPEVTPTPVLVSDGARVVTAASATFSFAGKRDEPPQDPVTGTSTIALAATRGILTVGGADPLLDGDRKDDAFGNLLEVDSDATLRIGR